MTWLLAYRAITARPFVTLTHEVLHPPFMAKIVHFLLNAADVLKPLKAFLYFTKPIQHGIKYVHAHEEEADHDSGGT
jgi:hypothetical protein